MNVLEGHRPWGGSLMFCAARHDVSVCGKPCAERHALQCLVLFYLFAWLFFVAVGVRARRKDTPECVTSGV